MRTLAFWLILVFRNPYQISMLRYKNLVININKLPFFFGTIALRKRLFMLSGDLNNRPSCRCYLCWDIKAAGFKLIFRSSAMGVCDTIKKNVSNCSPKNQSLSENKTSLNNKSSQLAFWVSVANLIRRWAKDSWFAEPEIW